MGGEVLVIEGDNDVRETLAELLRAWGVKARTARGGQEAIRALHEMSRLPSVILLDLYMPLVNGDAFHEFRERQLADPKLSGIPVVVLGADLELHDRAASLNITAVRPVPVRFSRLKATIERYCNAD